jgi:oxygen-independent coproporphyrinogen-3 oxidase
MHLYLHIPFCRQAGYYCDFHFSTNLTHKREVIEAISKEIEIRADYLKEKELTTIYFGGGTPSLLNASEFDLIFETVARHFSLSSDIEITLEANPDDITLENLQLWKKHGINRLSIGIQTFNEDHLRFINRIHSSFEAENSVKMAQDFGFSNLSLDLIYAIHGKQEGISPDKKHDIWLKDLEKIVSFDVPHISCYCLTIEEKTVFGKWQKTNKIPPIDDEFASEQFELLISKLGASGYEQYEISNFAKNGHYSRHNTSYWQGHEYLGVGPSAHSFNGVSRQYNVSQNKKYTYSLGLGKVPFEIEHLTPQEQANDYILTGLRTKWGIDLRLLQSKSGEITIEFEETLKMYLDSEHLLLAENTVTLTKKGKLFADGIASDLFF